MSKKHDWVGLLTQWKYGHLTRHFSANELTDPTTWYYLTEEDLTNFGLSTEKQRESFKKLVDQWTRQQWIKEDLVEIYSQSRGKWFGGTIINASTDTEGEWLTIRYNKSTSKQVQRFCEDVRPVQKTTPIVSNTNKSKKHRPRSGSVVIDTPNKADINLLTQLTINRPQPNLTNSDSNSPKPDAKTTLAVRKSWVKGDFVEVYSRSKVRWLCGSIFEIGNDEEGEYLEVHYHDPNTKQSSRKRVSRMDEEVRAVLVDSPAGETPDEPHVPVLKPSEKQEKTVQEKTLQQLPADSFSTLPQLDDSDSEDNDRKSYNYHDSSTSYRMKELGDLRREYHMRHANINELKAAITELSQQLEKERRALEEIQTRLKVEEQRFKSQEGSILKQTRKRWKPGDFMEVYSSSRGKWFMSECVEIFEDGEGEWLQVFYCDTTSGQQIMKQIQRFSEDLRPCKHVLIPPIGVSTTEELNKIYELPEREEEERKNWEAMLEERKDAEKLAADAEQKSPETQSPETPSPEPTEIEFESKVYTADTSYSPENDTSDNDQKKDSKRRQSTSIESDDLVKTSFTKEGVAVRIMYKNQPYDVHAKNSMPVSHLMNRIRILLHINVDDQDLFYNGEKLIPNKLLSCYNIREKDTIYLEGEMIQRRVDRERGARQSRTDQFFNAVPDACIDSGDKSSAI